jgi:hypothetical protein
MEKSMSSMPFPDGTWNFQVVPVGGGPLNGLVQRWGLMTFQTSNGQHQLVLQVGVNTSQPVNVTWSSVTPDLGTITSNPSFTVGSHTYAFTTITVMSFPVAGGTHRSAFCLLLTVDQTAAWFVALPNTSVLLPPKPGSYTVADSQTGASFCILNVAGDDIAVTAGSGYVLQGPVIWHKPTQVWPPTISWNLKNTSSGAILSFSGALTTSTNPLLRQITWQFGGTYGTAGGPQSDDDWNSTTNSDPFVGIVARKSYA